MVNVTSGLTYTGDFATKRTDQSDIDCTFLIYWPAGASLPRELKLGWCTQMGVRIPSTSHPNVFLNFFYLPRKLRFSGVTLLGLRILAYAYQPRSSK